jgi:hypothetical protein
MGWGITLRSSLWISYTAMQKYNFKLIYSEYEELSSNGKLIFLATASFNLTLELRGLRGAPELLLRSASMGLNEIQHKLTSHLISKLKNVEGYPDDVFFEILQEIAEINAVVESTFAALTDAAAKSK